MSQINSDFLLLWHLVGWRLLGFPQFSTFWVTFLVSSPSDKMKLWISQSAGFPFNPLAAQRSVLCRQGFCSLLFQMVVGVTQASITEVYQQCCKEWTGWCAWEGVPNSTISTLKLADFLFTYLGLAWLSTLLVFIILLFLFSFRTSSSS